MSEDLMEALGEEVTLESFVPQYLNQAITFTGDDMGSDRAMITMLLYMIIVIIAFVFGITISNTIRNSAGFRVYKKRTDRTLHGTSGDRHADRCVDWKYSGLYSTEKSMCGDVLWKL